ncbi:hypothetical protein ABZ714_28800 [Streptomyces sp. NPDC006798]|uniref:hypothetical protein n=1 Tax=Streptomyces sp. NPDC006798 TaxID=3155462 RepID=UPI0033DF342E
MSPSSAVSPPGLLTGLVIPALPNVRTDRAAVEQVLEALCDRFALDLVYGDYGTPRARAIVAVLCDDLERAVGDPSPSAKDIVHLVARLRHALEQLVAVLNERHRGAADGEVAVLLARGRRALAAPSPPGAAGRESVPAGRGSRFCGPRAREALARAAALSAPVPPAVLSLRRLALPTLDLLDIWAGTSG